VYLPAKRKVIRARDVRVQETVRAEDPADIYKLSFEKPADLEDDAAAEGVIQREIDTLRRIDIADTAIFPEVPEPDQRDSDPLESNSDIRSYSQLDTESDTEQDAGPDAEPDAEPDTEQDAGLDLELDTEQEAEQEAELEPEVPVGPRRSTRANKGQKRLPEMDVNWQEEKRDRLARNRLQRQQMQANFICAFYTNTIPNSHQEAISLPDADK